MRYSWDMKQKFDELKERPKEERSAVASSMAVIIMFILFLGWAFVFFNKVSSGEELETTWGPRSDIVDDLDSFDRASDQLSDSYFDATEELRRIRDAAAARAQREYEREQRERAPREKKEEEQPSFGL